MNVNEGSNLTTANVTLSSAGVLSTTGNSNNIDFNCEFYARSLDDNSILNKEPFLTFDLNDFNSNDLDNLMNSETILS